MKHFAFLSMAILAMLSFASCIREESSAVSQDRIFTEYELFYNANEDKTYARASFKFSNALGTKLDLTDPSKVLFNDQELTFNPVLAYYEKEFAGLVPSGTFKWTDLDGNVFVNAIEIHQIAYAPGIDTIARDAAFELGWTGSGLAQNELVTVTVNGENEADAQIFSTNNVGAQSIILAKDKLAKLGAGPGTVYLDRSYLPTLTEKTGAGGILLGRYRPANLQVVIK